MKLWLWSASVLAVLLIAVSVVLEASGVSLIVDTLRARNVDLVITMRGIGVGLAITAVVVAAFSLPLAASVRRVRGHSPSDLVVVGQRVTKESPFRRVGSIESFPSYFVVVISPGDVRFFDRGSRLFLHVDAEQIAGVGTGSTVIGWRTWGTVRLDARAGGSLEFLPCRDRDVLAPLGDEPSVRPLAETIRLRLGLTHPG